MDDKMQINTFKIKCHKIIQTLRKHRSLVDGKIYHIGQCVICKKYFIYDGKFIEGRAAKRKFLKLKGFIKEIKTPKVYKNSMIDDNFHYYISCRRYIRNKKGEIIAISEGQTEKLYKSNISTGFRTKRQRFKIFIKKSCVP